MDNTKNEGEMQFSALLEQIRKCLDNKLYYVAMITSLVIPDICGSIDSENGIGDQKKYIAWFNKYVMPRYIGETLFTGDRCYYLRCSMLHQGKTKHSKIKVVFIRTPQSNAFVNPIFIRNNTELLVDLHTFCNNMINAAYDWLEAVCDSDRFKKNMGNFMKLYSLIFIDG